MKTEEENLFQNPGFLKKAGVLRAFRGWRGRLLGSFLVVILTSLSISVVIVALVVPLRVDEVSLLVNRRRAFELTLFLADTYRQSGSWQNAPAWAKRFADPLPPELWTDMPFSYLPPLPPLLFEALAQDRLVLAGADGRVVADSRGELPVGQPLPPDLRRYAVPIVAQDQPVGSLVIMSGLTEQLSSLVLVGYRRLLAGAGLLGGTLAALVSLWLAQRLVTPLQRLGLAARQLASGESSAPLPVESNDEIGELTRIFNDMTGALNRQKYLRRQMVADITHELRAPVSMMRLDVESLADGLQDPAEAVVSLREEVNRLSRLVEDLRLLSLAEAGGLHFTLEELDVAAFLGQLLETWTPQAQAQQVRLLAEISDPLPSVYADAGRLGQVFNNLLSNALRYTPAGQAITLGARLKGKELVLWVTDSGPGIASEDLPFVFERFYRADRSRSRDNGGSGLGLAIARQWVALHGGRIWVESEVGRGATFSVGLPVTQTA
jgi:signal transduction histidine kinase